MTKPAQRTPQNSQAQESYSNEILSALNLLLGLS